MVAHERKMLAQRNVIRTHRQDALAAAAAARNPAAQPARSRGAAAAEGLLSGLVPAASTLSDAAGRAALRASFLAAARQSPALRTLQEPALLALLSAGHARVLPAGADLVFGGAGAGVQDLFSAGRDRDGAGEAVEEVPEGRVVLLLSGALSVVTQPLSGEGGERVRRLLPGDMMSATPPGAGNADAPQRGAAALISARLRWHLQRGARAQRASTLVSLPQLDCELALGGLLSREVATQVGALRRAEPFAWLSSQQARALLAKSRLLLLADGESVGCQTSVAAGEIFSATCGATGAAARPQPIILVQSGRAAVLAPMHPPESSDGSEDSEAVWTESLVGELAPPAHSSEGGAAGAASPAAGEFAGESLHCPQDCRVEARGAAMLLCIPTAALRAACQAAARWDALARARALPSACAAREARALAAARAAAAALRDLRASAARLAAGLDALSSRFAAAAGVRLVPRDRAGLLGNADAFARAARALAEHGAGTAGRAATGRAGGGFDAGAQAAVAAEALTASRLPGHASAFSAHLLPALARLSALRRRPALRAALDALDRPPAASCLEARKGLQRQGALFVASWQDGSSDEHPASRRGEIDSRSAGGLAAALVLPVALWLDVCRAAGDARAAAVAVQSPCAALADGVEALGELSGPRAAEAEVLLAEAGALLATAAEVERLGVAAEAPGPHPFSAYTGGDLVTPHRRVLASFRASLVCSAPGSRPGGTPRLGARGAACAVTLLNDLVVVALEGAASPAHAASPAVGSDPLARFGAVCASPTEGAARGSSASPSGDGHSGHSFRSGVLECQAAAAGLAAGLAGLFPGPGTSAASSPPSPCSPVSAAGTAASGGEGATSVLYLLDVAVAAADAPGFPAALAVTPLRREAGPPMLLALSDYEAGPRTVRTVLALHAACAAEAATHRSAPYAAERQGPCAI